jgi:hypothetical protein
VLSLSFSCAMRWEPKYFQKDRRWAFRVSLGNDPVTGKRNQPQRQGYRTKHDAQEAAEALIREFDRNSGSAPSTDQLGPHLLDWLHTQRSSLRPSNARPEGRRTTDSRAAQEIPMMPVCTAPSALRIVYEMVVLGGDVSGVTRPQLNQASPGP